MSAPRISKANQTNGRFRIKETATKENTHPLKTNSVSNVADVQQEVVIGTAILQHIVHSAQRVSSSEVALAVIGEVLANRGACTGINTIRNKRHKCHRKLLVAAHPNQHRQGR